MRPAGWGWVLSLSFLSALAVLAVPIAACDIACIGFFDDAPISADLPSRPGPWDRPLDELPVAVPGDVLLLAHTGEVALGITVIWAFATGFEFGLRARFRRPGAAVGALNSGDSPHIGLQFADDRKVASIGRRVPEPVTGPPGLIMVPKAVTGGQSYLDWSYWVWPLPPAGLMTFACEWAAYSIIETSKQIEAEPIVRAARQSIRLWPARAS